MYDLIHSWSSFWAAPLSVFRTSSVSLVFNSFNWMMWLMAWSSICASTSSHGWWLTGESAAENGCLERRHSMLQPKPHPYIQLPSSHPMLLAQPHSKAPLYIPPYPMEAEIWEFTDPLITCCIQLHCAPDLSQRVVVCVDSEVWSIVQIVKEAHFNARNCSFPLCTW